MKKKIIIVMVVTGLMFSIMGFKINNAKAASLNNRTSFSVGANYKKNALNITQIDTTGDAEYAYNAYKSMGWLSVITTAPMTTYMKGKHSNGYYRLESSILFFSGHGNSSSMEWNYKQLGSSYKVGIRAASNNSVYSDGSEYIGLGQYRNTQNDLVVFAGCETAKGTSNISKYIVDQGAETSIGWTVSIAAGSHTNWLKRFNDKLKTNYNTIQEAAVHASGYTYVDNGVKNYKIYGNKYQIPLQNFLIATNSMSNTLSIDNLHYVNKDISYNKTLSNEENIKLNIENTIKEYVDSSFNSADYQIEINGTDEIIYDYVFYVDGIRTDLGYSIIIDNNKMEGIYNNINENDTEEIKEIVKSVSKEVELSAKTIYNYGDKALKKAELEYPDSSFSIMREITYYKIDTGDLY